MHMYNEKHRWFAAEVSLGGEQTNYATDKRGEQLHILQYLSTSRGDQGSDVPVNHLSGLVSLHTQCHKKYKVLGSVRKIFNGTRRK